MGKLFLSLVLSFLFATASSATIIPLVSAIDGSQVVPPTLSLAFGTGTYTLDDVTHVLDLSVVVTSVLLFGAETTAQLHGPAAVGVNGPTLADLSTGSLKTGSLDLTLLAGCSGDVAACEGDIVAGLWYLLVSSEALPDGEIRGQITPVLPIPEPAAAGLLLLGLAGLAVVGWRPA